MSSSTGHSYDHPILEASKHAVPCRATRFGRRFLVASPAAAGYRPRCFYRRYGAAPEAHVSNGNARRLSAVRPNPSLNRSTNGGPPGPRTGLCYLPSRGPGVPPLAPG
jgi:hypothetical protein